MADFGNRSENGKQKVVIAGASNLKYSVAYFKDPNLEFTDLCSPGWVPTPGNVTTLKDGVGKQLTQNARGFVFDLFGNTSVRFEQFDSSTALPYNSNGKYHLGGEVVVSPPDVFRKTVETILTILVAKGEAPCVIVPPIPRYLFSRCCDDPGHCTNANNADYSEKLLSGFMHMRNN